jgi:hypothetical protein
MPEVNMSKAYALHRRNTVDLRKRAADAKVAAPQFALAVRDARSLAVRG